MPALLSSLGFLALAPAPGASGDPRLVHRPERRPESHTPAGRGEPDQQADEPPATREHGGNGDVDRLVHATHPREWALPGRVAGLPIFAMMLPLGSESRERSPRASNAGR